MEKAAESRNSLRLSGGLKMCGRGGMMTDFTEHHRSETITKRSSIDFAITSIPFRSGSLAPDSCRVEFY